MTPERIKMIQQAINRTWDYIACDMLNACGEDTMSKDEIVDVTLDADYLEMYGCGYNVEDKTAFKELVAEFRLLPFSEQNKIADATWKWKRCGR